MQLEDKVAILTSAAIGICEAVARRYLAEGAWVPASVDQSSRTGLI